MASSYWSILFGWGIAVVLVTFLIVVACYVLFAYPLYKMAVKVGVDNAWLAWIPIAQMYVLCMLSEEPFTLFGSWTLPKRSYGFWLWLGLRVVAVILRRIPLIGGLLSFVCYVGAIICVWRMYYDMIRRFNNGSSDGMVLSVFSAIIPIVGVVAMLVYCKNEPVRADVDSGYTGY
jgi:hypothetical protein